MRLAPGGCLDSDLGLRPEPVEDGVVGVVRDARGSAVRAGELREFGYGFRSFNGSKA